VRKDEGDHIIPLFNILHPHLDIYLWDFWMPSRRGWRKPKAPLTEPCLILLLSLITVFEDLFLGIRFDDLSCALKQRAEG